DLESRDGSTVIALSVECMSYCYGGIPRGEMGDADSEFLEHARADVPALVAEVRRLRRQLDTTRAALGEISELVSESAIDDEDLYGVLVSVRRVIYEREAADG